MLIAASSEIKARLAAWSDGSTTLDEFRLWFADLLRASRRYDEDTQALIWSVDFAFANYGLKKWSLLQFRTYLKAIADSAAYAINIDLSGAVSTSASNDLQKSEAVEFAGQRFGTVSASECVTLGFLQNEHQTNEGLPAARVYQLAQQS